MAWDDIARLEHSRRCVRYPSDLTEREWALVAPLLPLAKPGGRPRTTCLREVLNAILNCFLLIFHRPPRHRVEWLPVADGGLRL
jgi:hypothetical protein